MIPQVERLSGAGFALHWLHPKSKRPIGSDWASKPVASVDLLRKTYAKGNNLGVRLGQWSKVGGYYLHIIDVDIRIAEKKDHAFRKLESLFPGVDFNTMAAVRSGSGGESLHYYILTEKPYPPRKFAHSTGHQMVWDAKLEKSVKKWDWELHLLGTGAQAAIPPSIHPDTEKEYVWIREPDFQAIEFGLAATVPTDIIESVIEYEDPDLAANPDRYKPLDLDRAAIESILDDIPYDQWFEDRDGWLNTGMALHHQFEGKAEGFNLWTLYSKRSEKFDLDDAKRVWKSFKNRAGKPFRMASLLAVARDKRAMDGFDDIEDEFDDLGLDGLPIDPIASQFDDLLGGFEDQPVAAKKTPSQVKLVKEELEIGLGRDAPEWVYKLNQKHAVARVSGKTVIMDFQTDGGVAYGSVTDLHNFYENDRRPKDDTTVPVTKLWIQHKQRRDFPNGIVFLPNRVVEGAYNHWQGFSVEPNADADGCKLFLQHLREVFCAGNDKQYAYMIRYWAHMVQKPEDKPGVAIVARGKKRIGKDTVFEYMGKLIEHHYITVGNQEQMLGKFNAHQEKVLFLHMQEGFWAGDKKAEGQLKYLITSRDVMIEPKGMNAFRVKSVLRLGISSNEQWVVPATSDEGRYLVLNVSAHRKGDREYFENLYAEMETTGPAALLHYLQNFDLRGFNVRAVPDTEALAEQKVQGLKNVDRWWLGVLQAGEIENAQNKDGVGNSVWGSQIIRVNKEELREGYSRWMRTRRYDGEEVSPNEFTARIHAMCPHLTQTRPRTGGRARVYVLPDLDACRRAFESFIASELVWPDQLLDDTVEEEPDDLG